MYPPDVIDPYVGLICVDSRGWVIEVLGVRRRNVIVEFVHLPNDLKAWVGKIDYSDLAAFYQQDWIAFYDTNEVPL